MSRGHAADAARPGSTRTFRRCFALTDPITVVIADDHILLRECRRTQLEVAGRFAVVGEAGDDASAVAMLRRGVHGYLSKGVRVQELTSALRAVHDGRRYVEPDLAQRLASQLDATEGRGLTPREVEILGLLVQGLRDRDIADRLSISLQTARFHVGNLRRKLGARSTASALVRAREQRQAS